VACGILDGMQVPLFVRPLTDAERQALEAGLHSSDAFVLRRCQILLASARRARPRHRPAGGLLRASRPQRPLCLQQEPARHRQLEQRLVLGSEYTDCDLKTFFAANCNQVLQ
jgi:hypothetical protein